MISDLKSGLKDSIDGVLEAAVAGQDALDGVPGVIAMVTDRKGNVYEGTAGVRDRA